MRFAVVFWFAAGCGATPGPKPGAPEYRWPIINICDPIERRIESPRVIKDLGDGTKVYQTPDGRYFRGRDRFCT